MKKLFVIIFILALMRLEFVMEKNQYSRITMEMDNSTSEILKVKNVFHFKIRISMPNKLAEMIYYVYG